MGARCCKRSSVDGVPYDDDLFEGNVYNTGRGCPQALFVGMQGSGKSTLLYTTILPEWVEIISEIPPTLTAHYEVYRRGNSRVGFWELGGSQTMQSMWATFWQLVRFEIVVFVVSALERDHTTSREWIRRLSSEDELRNSNLVVIINSFDQAVTDDAMEGIVASLNLAELQKTMDAPYRLRWLLVNARAGERDANWQRILNWMPQATMQKEGIR